MSDIITRQFDNIKFNEIDENATYMCSRYSTSSGFNILMKYALLGKYVNVNDFF
jgi:hypothetical protein